jgi:hypothetical protein
MSNETYLIVVEAEGEGGAYHYQPYRVASSYAEAVELMYEYMGLPEDFGALPVRYFALYKERAGIFGLAEYYEPTRPILQQADAADWLAETGRC